jgi:glycosyltransferase involved in cell wall biosynthesis
MTEPLVSALMPVKAFHPEYLQRALASMLDQTCPAWRLVIIVEEPPTDGLHEALRLALDDERIRVVVNEGRKLSGAINTGMRHATTEYTAILLGDDMWAPEAVATLVREIERSPEVDFFHSSRMIIDERDRPISSVHRARTSFALADFARGSPVKHLLCWKRRAGLAVGGLDETLNSVGPDDYDFPWTMAEAGMRFEAVSECLYLYRDHRECYRLTTHLPRSTHTHELRRILRKHGTSRLRTELSVNHARVTYLRQCLYRSRLDRGLKERLGFDPRRGWRDTYQ